MARKNKNPAKWRWYYDSCTLGESKSAYAEMFNTQHPIEPVISHLAFGEAFGNSFLKGSEQVDAFVELMDKLRPYIRVVENDVGNKTLNRVREHFPALSITDALHVATAVENKCVCIRTADGDLCDLPVEKIRGFRKESGMPQFSITKMSYSK